MKKLLSFFVFLIISTTAIAQKSQYFTKDFTTSSGIYGYAKITTQPTTVGFGYIWIQQDAVVVQGVNYNGQNYTGNTLSNYGVTFPFNCSNCFFYADGRASMNIKGNFYYGNFSKGGTINSGGLGKTNQSINFSEKAKQLHNDEVRRLGYSLWERNGRVESLNIHKVKGADFGKITRAIDNYNRDREKTEKYNSLTDRANRTNDPNEKISLLKQALSYADGQQKAAINSEINRINNELRQQRTKDKSKSNTQKKSNTSTAYNQNSNKNNTSNSSSSTSEITQNSQNNNTSFYTPSTSTSQINTQLQSQGYSQLVQGDYLGASFSLAASGDTYGALAASGIAFFDEILRSLKEARDNKIRVRIKRLKTTLDDIDADTKKLSEYYNENDIDKFTTLSYKVLTKKIDALENGFDLIRTERSHKKGTYKAKMGKIWVDIFKQLNYTINNKFSSPATKKQLLLEIPFLFQSSRKAINLYNAKVPNKEAIDAAFAKVYKDYVSQNFHLYSPKEQLDLFLLTPLSLEDYKRTGLNIEKLGIYFQSLSSIEQENLFMGQGIKHRLDIQKTPFINNSDLDNKINFLLENGLDYHFKISNSTSFKQLIASEVFSTDIFDGNIKKLKGLKIAPKNLKKKIKEDKLSQDKSYNDIVDEKYINRFLDTINSKNYNLDDIVAIDDRFKVFEDLDDTKYRAVIFWNKSVIPSFKKVNVIVDDNKDDATELMQGRYFMVDSDAAKMIIKTNIYSNELKIEPILGEINFIELNLLKGKKEVYIKSVETKKGIRLVGTLKDVNQIKDDEKTNEDSGENEQIKQTNNEDLEKEKPKKAFKNLFKKKSKKEKNNG